MWHSRRNRHDRWPRYVPVAERRQQAQKKIETLKKKGVTLNPVVVVGRTIAHTFWGKSWCENLEKYSDYSSRLSRGRSYLRNGSILDLQITKGQVKAQVMGSSLYNVTINVKEIVDSQWQKLAKTCAGKIDSMIELLQGKFSKAVMEIMTRKEEGLFPKPQEISMSCSCPDFAVMCKHVAAVLYGIGATLDHKPEWLFELRHVNHVDLISSAGSAHSLTSSNTETALVEGELADIFGIELETSKPLAAIPVPKRPTKKNPSKPKASASKTKDKKDKGKAQKIKLKGKK